MTSSIPALRIRSANDAPIAADGDYVLYWMIAHRRLRWNFSLDRAIELAHELDRPLIVFEPLRIGYRWACERFHRFVVDGMIDNAREVTKASTGDKAPITYLAYVEPVPDAGKGLLEALGARACAVVTDRYPSYFLPRMVAAAARRLPVRVEEVDSNGLLPLDAADKAFSRAFAFRRFLQRRLPEFLEDQPSAKPLEALELPGLALSPEGVPEVCGDDLDGWRFVDVDRGADAIVAGVDQGNWLHEVPAAALRGGSGAANERLADFLENNLDRYAEGRNQPDDPVDSMLSPYLHFGHISSHQIFDAIAKREDWNGGRLSDATSGKRTGWWGMGEGAEAFLDQLVTWREIGYNFSARRDDEDAFESLPDWARATLLEHAEDERPSLYDLDQFAAAETHDPIWNAAQRQLVREGRIHNYLRMLWGKKILHWTPNPRIALEIMIELNNRYALDGRDPNSYSGIFWCLGRYDRAWGPEREVFGKIRYMSSDSTRRKLRLTGYLEKYGAQSGVDQLSMFSPS